jgi:hypothetical protein
MSRSNSLNTVAPARRNEIRNQNLNSRHVSVEDAWLQALHTGGLHVSDGSLYEPVATTTAEPEIELIAEVGAKGLRNFPVPPCAYHLRVQFSDGTEWFVSFNGGLVEDTDGARTYLEAQISNFHIDGQTATPDAVEHLLAPAGIEAIEEWLLGDRRGE